jgi:CheY-like chemotaxis protein
MDKAVRVLVVDDEPDFLEPLAFWLTARGYVVRKAPNGLEALRMLSNEVPDILFLDINMPGMDGIETLAKVRQSHPRLPVLIVTAAYQDEEKFSKAQALGISGFVPKQSSLPELIQILEVTLRTHGRLKSPESPGK